jgi:hypothetical protein
MTFHARLALTLPAVGVLLWLSPASIASAQDVMELDLAFKNGQLQGHAPEGRQEGNELQGQRHDTREAHGRVEAKKRDARRRRGQRR